MSPNLYHVARPLAPGWDRSLGRVAGDLASAGVPVFPCVPGQKRPLTPRGFHDASTDPEQVERWWGRWPDANLGLPTGAVSGVVVVDVDVREDVDGRESMRRALDAGWVGMPVFTVVSPSGGRHGYYPALSSVVQRSWQAARAGVDFRGDGGYIVIPPSHTAVGSYRLATVRQGVAAGIDSDTLREFLDPRPVLQPRAAADRGVAQNEPGVVVSRLAAWVAGLGEGERNRGLFWAACRAATHYDPAVLAVELTDERVATFLRVIEHTVAFADALQAALTNPTTPPPPPAALSMRGMTDRRVGVRSCAPSNRLRLLVFGVGGCTCWAWTLLIVRRVAGSC